MLLVCQLGAGIQWWKLDMVNDFIEFIVESSVISWVNKKLSTVFQGWEFVLDNHAEFRSNRFSPFLLDRLLAWEGSCQSHKSCATPLIRCQKEAEMNSELHGLHYSGLE